MVDLLESALEEAKRELKGALICVLGYAFLENSDDPRNTPTVPLLEELKNRGARYVLHDPYIKQTEEGYLIEPDLDKALNGCEAVVLMTKHNQYKSITPDQLNNLMRTKVIIDGRNLFEPEKFITSGFIFRGIGKGNINKL
jgi:UDP-N-acetyl-D-mannosaminuronic acid dehydrogenase